MPETADSVDLAERSVFQTPGDNMFDRVEDLVPGGAKGLPGAGKWQREQTAAEPLRGRTATSMLFLSALKWGC
jgi:hypothetical protein